MAGHFLGALGIFPGMHWSDVSERMRSAAREADLQGRLLHVVLINEDFRRGVLVDEIAASDVRGSIAIIEQSHIVDALLRRPDGTFRQVRFKDMVRHEH